VAAQGTAAAGSNRDGTAGGRVACGGLGDATGRGSAGARVRIPVARQQRIRHRAAAASRSAPVGGRADAYSTRLRARAALARPRAWETVPRVTCLGGSAPAFDRPGLRPPARPLARPPPMRRTSPPVCQRPVTRGEGWAYAKQARRCRPVRCMVVQTSGQRRDACAWLWLRCLPLHQAFLSLRSCCVPKGSGRNSRSSLLMARLLHRYRCQFQGQRPAGVLLRLPNLFSSPLWY
jgi:hypothetical protein